MQLELALNWQLAEKQNSNVSHSMYCKKTKTVFVSSLENHKNGEKLKVEKWQQKWMNNDKNERTKNEI